MKGGKARRKEKNPAKVKVEQAGPVPRIKEQGMKAQVPAAEKRVVEDVIRVMDSKENVQKAQEVLKRALEKAMLSGVGISSVGQQYPRIDAPVLQAAFNNSLGIHCLVVVIGEMVRKIPNYSDIAELKTIRWPLIQFWLKDLFTSAAANRIRNVEMLPAVLQYICKCLVGKQPSETTRTKLGGAETLVKTSLSFTGVDPETPTGTVCPVGTDGITTYFGSAIRRYICSFLRPVGRSDPTTGGFVPANEPGGPIFYDQVEAARAWNTVASYVPGLGPVSDTRGIYFGTNGGKVLDAYTKLQNNKWQASAPIYGSESDAATARPPVDTRITQLCATLPATPATPDNRDMPLKMKISASPKTGFSELFNPITTPDVATKTLVRWAPYRYGDILLWCLEVLTRQIQIKMANGWTPRPDILNRLELHTIFYNLVQQIFGQQNHYAAMEFPHTGDTSSYGQANDMLNTISIKATSIAFHAEIIERMREMFASPITKYDGYSFTSKSQFYIHRVPVLTLDANVNYPLQITAYFDTLPAPIRDVMKATFPPQYDGDATLAPVGRLSGDLEPTTKTLRTKVPDPSTPGTLVDTYTYVSLTQGEVIEAAIDRWVELQTDLSSSGPIAAGLMRQTSTVNHALNICLEVPPDASDPSRPRFIKRHPIYGDALNLQFTFFARALPGFATAQTNGGKTSLLVYVGNMMPVYVLTGYLGDATSTKALSEVSYIIGMEHNFGVGVNYAQDILTRAKYLVTSPLLGTSGSELSISRDQEVRMGLGGGFFAFKPDRQAFIEKVNGVPPETVKKLYDGMVDIGFPPYACAFILKSKSVQGALRKLAALNTLGKAADYVLGIATSFVTSK
jgi:hypothetical protein